MATKEIYMVEVERPDGVDVGRMTDYIRKAVNNWCGQYMAGDPLINLTEVKVRRAEPIQRAHVALVKRFEKLAQATHEFSAGVYSMTLKDFERNEDGKPIKFGETDS
ncbi:MAG: hypothetical protein KGL39_24575 [Patescibacteria group bacterium]|nr:hypothetical protein [Patescibacteria group bacterium]